MKQAAIFSSLLHIFVLTLLILGLPHFTREQSLVLQPIAVEMVTETAQETKAPRKTPIEELLEKYPEPDPKPRPVDPPKPQEKAHPVPKPSAPPKTEPKPEVRPQPKEPIPRPALKPKTIQTKPVPEKKSTPQKKPEQQNRAFDSVLKNLQKTSAAVATTPKEQTNEDAPVHAGDISDQISVSELDALRRQIASCWNIPAGARDAEDLVIQVWVSTTPDGRVRNAKIIPSAHMRSHPYYQIAAESALRAVLHPNCSPLKLPLAKYNQWKEFTFTFNPKEML